MRSLARWTMLVAVALAAPLVPFLLWDRALVAALEQLLAARPGPADTALLAVGALAADIFLPIPSSLVCTAAGARLGVVGGTAAAWLGMTLGACLGFGLARRCGAPWVERAIGSDDYRRTVAAASRAGPPLLILTRALPLVAEAAVLVFGASRLGWRPFLAATALANLGLAFVYSAWGRFAAERQVLPAALTASVAAPLLAAIVFRWRCGGRLFAPPSPLRLPAATPPDPAP